MTVNWILEHADCLDAMREMPEASIDAVVTDPPYGLSFRSLAAARPASRRSRRGSCS